MSPRSLAMRTTSGPREATKTQFPKCASSSAWTASTAKSDLTRACFVSSSLGFILLKSKSVVLRYGPHIIFNFVANSRPGREPSRALGALEGNQRQIQKQPGRHAWLRQRAGPGQRGAHVG